MSNNEETKIPRERRPMTQIARRLRRDSTPSEARVWEVVRRKQVRGLRFLRQHDMGHFVLDFYCASLRLALEIDGSVKPIIECVFHYLDGDINICHFLFKYQSFLRRQI